MPFQFEKKHPLILGKHPFVAVLLHLPTPSASASPPKTNKGGERNKKQNSDLPSCCFSLVTRRNCFLSVFELANKASFAFGSTARFSQDPDGHELHSDDLDVNQQHEDHAHTDQHHKNGHHEDHHENQRLGGPSGWRTPFFSRRFRVDKVRNGILKMFGEPGPKTGVALLTECSLPPSPKLSCLASVSLQIRLGSYLGGLGVLFWMAIPGDWCYPR